MTSPKGTDCASVLSQIEAYVDGELGVLQCSAIEQHCEQCERCAAIVQGLRRTIGLCQEIGRAQLPPSVSRLARDQVRRLLESSRDSPLGRKAT
jgi:anti-sigma factor RsiW